ncbi:unnamed protein product [Mytilus coruscus]|uniref:MEGF10_11 n=1 Tax=Mytilus coruscus TaxID=42192 RepID=A0A6J8D5W2_MYTCO|nr:unnamed protein product [Mytilus coruscus]
MITLSFRLVEDKIVIVESCCYNFYKKNEVCVECPTGYFSKGKQCEKCGNGQYGNKCSEVCICNDKERCDHVWGCITVEDKTEKTNPPLGGNPDDQIAAITLRELVLFFIIVLLSLFILFGLLHKYRKRRKKVLLNQQKDNELNTNENRRGNQQDEERMEGVYNEIDESAMNTLTSRNLFRHSYFEITDSLGSTIHTKGSSTPSSTSLERFSSQYQSLRQTSHRNQSISAEESTHDLQSAVKGSNDLHCAVKGTNDIHSDVGSEYSDGYLRPRSIVQLQSMEIVFGREGTSLSKLDKVTGIQNDEYMSKESIYDVIGRSMSYNTLILKDVKSPTTEIGVVDNPIYNETVNRYPKDVIRFSKSKTI